MLKKVSIEYLCQCAFQVSIRLQICSSRLQKLPWSEAIQSDFNICTELASIISLISLSLSMKVRLTDVQHTEIMHML